MAHPLQDKDAQWRHRGQGARPIFDPGLAPPSTDEEAGGAPSRPSAPGGPAEPLPTEPVFQPGGPILSAKFWYGAAFVILFIMAIFAIVSL